MGWFRLLCAVQLLLVFTIGIYALVYNDMFIYALCICLLITIDFGNYMASKMYGGLLT